MNLKKNTLKNATCVLVTSISLLALPLSSCTKNSDTETMNSAGASAAAATVAAGTQPQNAALYTASAVINLSNAHDMTISGKSIAGGSSPCINLSNCYNITITGCKLYNSNNVGVHLTKCYGITVKSNYITHVSSGVYAVQCTSGIQVTGNQMLNMVGPYPRGQFVQFDNVTGANNTVAGNKCQNILGQSYPEDAISIYESHGTAASPITVNNNQIMGGGPSKTGGGINLGDNGGSYLSASGNVLVNPGQYGIQISGGDHNSLINNTVYGAKQSFTNVGLSVWGQVGYSVTNATVSGNKVLFYNSSGQQNDEWLGPGSTGTNTPAGWSTNVMGAALTVAVLPTTLITMQ